MAQQYTEYELKSAYVYNFGKFIEWPDSVLNNPAAPFIIGVYGNNDFCEVLKQTIQNKTIKNRSVLIINVTTNDEMLSCSVIFISKVNKLQLAQIIHQVANKPILTVGDNIEEFCQSGGIINFTGQYSQKRFEINSKASARASLIISSKLLALSRIVTDDEVKF